MGERVVAVVEGLEHHQARSTAALSAAAATVAASSALAVKGFSHRTCLPAARAARVHSAVEAVGEGDVDGVDVRVVDHRLVAVGRLGGIRCRAAKAAARWRSRAATTSTVTSGLAGRRPDEGGRGDASRPEHPESHFCATSWLTNLLATRPVRPVSTRESGPCGPVSCQVALVQRSSAPSEGRGIQCAVARATGFPLRSARSILRRRARWRVLDPDGGHHPADHAPGAGDEHRPLEAVGQGVGMEIAQSGDPPQGRQHGHRDQVPMRATSLLTAEAMPGVGLGHRVEGGGGERGHGGGQTRWR